MTRDKLVEIIRLFGTDYTGPVSMLAGISGESLADRILAAYEDERKGEKMRSLNLQPVDYIKDDAAAIKIKRVEGK